MPRYELQQKFAARSIPEIFIKNSSVQEKKLGPFDVWKFNSLNKDIHSKQKFNSLFRLCKMKIAKSKKATLIFVVKLGSQKRRPFF